MWWMDGQYCFYMSVNKSSYIYFIILLFELNSNDVEISLHYVLKQRQKLEVFLLFIPPENSDGPQMFKSVYLLCIITVNQLSN